MQDHPESATQSQREHRSFQLLFKQWTLQTSLKEVLVRLRSIEQEAQDMKQKTIDSKVKEATESIEEALANLTQVEQEAIKELDAALPDLRADAENTDWDNLTNSGDQAPSALPT